MSRHAVLLMLAACSSAFALNPALDVSQYAHTSWKNRDGFAKGEINDIAQTAGGHLWLGTAFGILRFDGIRTTSWQPPPGQHLPSEFIAALLSARDGTIWIGMVNGLASWNLGKIRQYPELAGFTVAALAEAGDGAVWAGGFSVNDGKLCEIRGGNVRCDPQIHGPRQGVISLHEDSRGNLWAGLFEGVWRWKPGAHEFYPIPDEPNGIKGFADSPDGGILIAAPGGLRRLSAGKSSVAWPFPNSARASGVTRLLRDRGGGLWVGTLGAGIFHFHDGRTDVFGETDGLSSGVVTSLFEDREGNIWVGTDKGLDRFRDLPVVTYTTKQGLSSSPLGAVLAARDGSVWFGMRDGLKRLKDGRITAYRAPGSNPIPGMPEIHVRNMPEHGVASLFQDSRGRIWFATRGAVGRLEGDRFIASPVPGGNVDAFAEDAGGNIWVVHQDRGLFRITPQNEATQTLWAALGHKEPADPMVFDPAGGGLWLGFHDGGLGWFSDDRIRKAYGSSDGLAKGRVTDLRLDRDGALWIAAEGGVSRLSKGRFASLNSHNGLPCDTVFWTIEDDERSLWLSMPCGLVRIARPELDAWLTAGDGVHRTLHTAVFDNSDGAGSLGSVGGYTPRVARSRDGKLWFVSSEGISSVDPRHLPLNTLVPPVYVNQINADRKIYDAAQGKVQLPALVRDIEIDYTALSLTAPEKVRFRYKLEGKDADWHDVGNRRQAFYNDLPPRDYRFRVMAANNSGVWNEAGAAFDFSVAPAYYQSVWFQFVLAAAIGTILGGLYYLRKRQLVRQFDVRMQERVDERTRIARDLHDTLLQSFQGVLLKFTALSYRLPEDSPTRTDLEDAIDRAREAITEGRDAVQGLRSSTLISNDLARSIGAIGEELVGDQTEARRSDFRIQVEGESRELPPLVRDEVYRVAIEALRNAFRHAEARAVEVEIRYNPRQFQLLVRDDGKGIDQGVLGAGGRAGHHGMAGMHERARLVGGKLAIWSRPGAGTEIELTIPSAIAYRKITLSGLGAAR